MKRQNYILIVLLILTLLLLIAIIIVFRSEFYEFYKFLPINIVYSVPKSQLLPVELKLCSYYVQNNTRYEFMAVSKSKLGGNVIYQKSFGELLPNDHIIYYNEFGEEICRYNVASWNKTTCKASRVGPIIFDSKGHQEGAQLICESVESRDMVWVE